MNVYYTSGTVGDTYIILCKLYNIATNNKIICKHFTKKRKLISVIKEVYSLLPNITVEFINAINKEKNIVGNFHANFDGTEFYPKFVLDPIDKFNLPKKYCVVQNIAGTSSTRIRKLGPDIINNIKLNGLKVVLVGYGKDTIDGVIDLRNKTSVSEVVNIIYNCSRFYGYQGFLSFVSLGAHKHTTIYVKDNDDKLAINSRVCTASPWVKHCKKIYLR